MSEAHQHLIVARDRAIAARADFDAAVKETMGQFKPERLREEATAAATQKVDDVKAALRRMVRRHPLLIWSLGLGLAVLVLWRPVEALVKRMGDLAGWLQQLRTEWRKADDR